MTQIVMSRDQLLERLREQRIVAEKRDAEITATHKTQEREWLDSTRKALRAAAKLSYADLKKRANSWGETTRINLDTGSVPHCPQSMVVRFDRAIEYVNLSAQKKFTLHGRGIWSDLFDLVTWDPNPPHSDVC